MGKEMAGMEGMKCEACGREIEGEPCNPCDQVLAHPDCLYKRMAKWKEKNPKAMGMTLNDMRELFGKHLIMKLF